MKKVIPNGVAIKQLREQLECLSTQKEMAHEIAVSVRMLRKIENENHPISAILLGRISKLLGVHRELITLSDPSVAAPASRPTTDVAFLHLDEDQLIPRHDWDYASVITDESKLFEEAAGSHDLACVIELGLTEETGAYAQELMDILSGLTWVKRDIRHDFPPSDQIAMRRRIRQLMVLLRGNDIWIYRTSVIRRLPERYDLPPEDEPSTLHTRIVIALGPPGEYGENSIRVPIDHGQPFILPSWENFRAKQAKAAC